MPRPPLNYDPDAQERRVHPLSIWNGVVVPIVAMAGVAWFAPLLPGDQDQLTVTFSQGGGIVESSDGTRAELSEGTAVEIGDRVVIPSGASATFSAREGHHVSLADSATLVVDGSRRSLMGGRTWTDLAVERGEVRVSGEAQPRASLEIGLPNGVAGVRGTDLTVNVQEGRTGVSVHDGAVRVSSGPEGAAELSRGQGAILAESGPEVKTLPAAPLIRPLPEGADIIRSPGTLLTWTNVPGAVAYAVSLGPDSTLQEVVHHTRVDSAFMEIPVLDVEEPLYVRVQALTPDGLTGHPSTPYPIEIAYHWTEGRRLRSEGDVQGSLEEFRLALERHPANADLHRDIGWSYYILGRHAEAFSAYERAREITPSDTEMLVELARVHFWLRNFGEAEAIYQSVLEEQPEYADALWGLGDTYRVQGRRTEALDLVQRALRADPNHPYAAGTLRELRGGG